MPAATVVSRALDVLRATIGLSLVPVIAAGAQRSPTSPVSMRAVESTAPTSMPIHAIYVNAPIHLDGILDEQVWRAAPAASRFVQREPTEGAPATRPTEVRMLVTDSAVIIGARMADDKSALFGAFGAPADGASGGYLSDYFEVQIDPHHDHVTAFVLAVAPGGGKKSWIMARDGTRDPSWEIHWDAATHVDDSGWSAELRIPISEFHVRPGTENWGVQYVRFSWRRQETDIYSSAVQRTPAMSSGSDAAGNSRP